MFLKLILWSINCRYHYHDFSWSLMY